MENKCLMPHPEPVPAQHRGLCSNCYQFVTRKIGRKETSWEKLMKQGLALDREKPGRKPKDWLKDVAW